MLRSLVESAGRFEDLPPTGYDDIDIRWVIEIGHKPGEAKLEGPYAKGDLRKLAPVRGDRAGKVAKKNVKPSLLVDKAAYALGLRDGNRIERGSLEHTGFKELLQKAAEATGDAEVKAIYRFLDGHWAVHKGALEQSVVSEVKPQQIVAFKVVPVEFPFEKKAVKGFWAEHLRQEYSEGCACCAVCGKLGAVVRIMPWQITLFGVYSCPISSFNERAFDSFGKDQTANSPLCFDCASSASVVLQYLVNSERHTRVLARDGSKGQGRSPLRNQLAVFWLKQSPEVERAQGELSLDIEALLAEPIGNASERSGPPADPMQLYRLFGVAWSGDTSALGIDRSRFYLAVLSPNKSRLVVREWIDASVETVVRRLAAYDAARTIIAPEGDGMARPTIADIVSALKPWKAKSASGDANLVRSLVRTAYLGTAPPEALLVTAVRRFRVPVRGKKADELELARRQAALAAAIKIVVTFGREEANTLQSLDKQNRSGPYLCGQLLAILEEAQLRASRWRINATLVDRFYGGASISPSTTLGRLLNQATQSHMPKIRKAGLGYRALEEGVEGVLARLDDSGGFPRTLTLREQGEFALGFYHQRAEFRAGRKPSGSAEETAGKEKEEGE